jgi:hypothetical protein
VDNFGIKCIGKEHGMHLIRTLKEHYEVEEDWEGRRYLGITLDWDYKNCEVHLSMPEYVERALARFNHPMPDKPQHQPHQHTIPTYGATVQYAKPEDTSQQLSPSKKKYIQEVIGTFLYYGCVVDSTMLTALSAIASAQAEPTEETMTGCKQFLDYEATHQDAILTYKASDMVLAIRSAASYLINPKHAAEQVDISFYHLTAMTQPTMRLFSTSHNSSRPLCPPQQKQNWEHSTSTYERPFHNE